jgi:hypothetical protein
LKQGSMMISPSCSRCYVLHWVERKVTLRRGQETGHSQRALVVTKKK